jgi:hypothetical protein
MSLISALVAVAIIGVLIVIFTQMMTNANKVSRSAQNDVDFDMLRMTITSRLDCAKTLGVLPTAPLPLICSEYSNVTLKNHSNTSIAPSEKLGLWDISAQCSGNEVIVKATRPGNEPLTGKPYASLPAATDLFGGTGKLCRPYFDTSYLGRYVKVETFGIAYDPPGSLPSSKCQISNGSTSSHPYAVAHAACPAGYTIFAGEGACFWGIVAASFPYGNGWSLSCCTFPGFQALALSSSWVKATCIRDDG